MTFEVVVRPAVVPNIRPQAAQPLPPPDDPTQGICTIRGSNGKFLDLAYSWSASTSSTKRHEIKRKVDEVRIYQKTDDGIVHKENFVDVHVSKKHWLYDGTYTTTDAYCGMQETKNVKIRTRDKIIRCDPMTNQQIIGE